MKKKHLIFNLIFCLTLFSSESKLLFEEKSFSLVTEDGTRITGGAFVYDKAEDKRVPMKKISSGYIGKKFKWNFKITRHARLYLMESRLINLTDQELYLEPGLMIQTPREKGDWYWGGFDILEADDKPIRRLGIRGKTSKHIGGGIYNPFPVSTLIGSQKAVILGQFQFDDVSYHAAKYLPGKKDAVLEFSQRIALGPGRTVPFRFVIGTIPVKFDREENVVQAFYDAFPEEWHPLQGQDNPWLWGAHSQYRAWYYHPDRETERRYYATLEWTYTPYKRSGDFYGRPEYWDYKPVFPITVSFAQHADGTFFDYRQLTLPEFHRMRRRIFLRNGRDFGYMFYTNPSWCEIQLAEKNFPDAINNDPDNGIANVLGPWSTMHDREIRMFPYGTTYAKNYKRDIKQLYHEYKLPGFTCDCGAPGSYYRGPAVRNPDLAGRAWDEKGVFIDEMVGVGKMIEYIHSLNPANPPIVWKNGPGKGDCIMIETSQFSPIFQSWMPVTRYNIGQRPALLHDAGYLVDKNIPNWRSMNHAKFFKELDKLGDHAVLSSLQYGMTDSHVTQAGNPQSIYVMPELLECIRIGWQALIPVRTDNHGKMLYRARYGHEGNTIFFYGSPWKEDLPLTFQVDNSFLGKGVNLFIRKMRDHSAQANTVRAGITIFQDVLPSRLPVLFESVLNFSSCPDLQATVHSQKDLHKIIYTIRLGNTQAFTAYVTPRRINTFHRKLTINGKKTDLKQPMEIPPQSIIRITYLSHYFKCGKEAITSFPFLNKNKMPVFTIQLPSAPIPAEIKEAGNLQNYFRFTARKKITVANKIPVSKNDDPSSKDDLPAIRILIGRNTPTGITRDGDIITFSAVDANQATTMMRLFNYAMDERFPYIIPFQPTESITKEMMAKFGLNNNHLPYSRCFETEVIQ